MQVVFQSSYNLVIGKESHVAWMGHGKLVPVPQKWPPGLKEENRLEMNYDCIIIKFYYYYRKCNLALCETQNQPTLHNNIHFKHISTYF